MPYSMKIKKYHTVRTILKSNCKFVERGKVNTPNTQIHDHLLSYLNLLYIFYI